MGTNSTYVTKTIKEIGAHIATLRPNGHSDCVYRNSYALALLPEAELIFGALVLDLLNIRAALMPHCWLRLDGQIIDFAWSAFPRQFKTWNGPMVNVLTAPPIGSDYGYIEQKMDLSVFACVIEEAQLDARDAFRNI